MDARTSLTARRPYRITTIVTLFALLFAGLFAIPSTTLAASDTTTSAVNFRIGPGTDYAILTVIPGGDAVEVLGSSENGFYPVRYNDATGYVSGQYLALEDGSSVDTSVSTGGPTGVAYVIDGALNLRSGASTWTGVLVVMPDAASLELTGSTSNGFYEVVYNGQTGWAYGEYVSQSGPTTSEPEEQTTPEPTAVPDDSEDTPATETGPTGTVYVAVNALNLRSGAATSSSVVTVLSRGTSATLTGEVSNGFSGVTVNGQTGWAYTEYLSSEQPAAQTTPTPSATTPSSSNSGGDITSIIYSAAAAYGQNGDDMLRVATCESGLNPSAVNASSGASGLFQFMPSTWATTPYADQDIFDATANANAAAWMWSVGRRGEWSCQ